MKSFDTKSIAAALGGEVKGREIYAPGPGKNTADRSLLVRVETLVQPFALQLYSFVEDPHDICREHVSGLLGGANIFIFPMPPAEISLLYWNAAKDIRGTLAERYLSSQGLIPDNSLVFEEIRRQLRFHPLCPVGKERVPCMLALERDIFSAEPAAAIRVVLDSNGNKIAKLFIEGGRGRAIKFCNIKNPHELTICDGLEIALAGIVTGSRPVWSLGKQVDLRAFPQIYGVQSLKVLTGSTDVELHNTLNKTKHSKSAKVDLFTVATTKNSDGSSSISVQELKEERTQFDRVEDFFE